MLECCASEEGSEEGVPFELLDVDFFDSEVLVIVYRPKDQQGKWEGARMLIRAPVGRDASRHGRSLITIIEQEPVLRRSAMRI